MFVCVSVAGCRGGGGEERAGSGTKNETTDREKKTEREG